MPRRLAAAAMLRLVAAGIRRDVGETLVELMRYKCSAFYNQSSFIGCITTKNLICTSIVSRLALLDAWKEVPLSTDLE
jgi:hypothetical protein